MATLIGLLVVAAVLTLIAGVVAVPFWLVWRLMRPWVRAKPNSWRAKAVATSLSVSAASVTISPYIAFKIWDRRATLARVPAPLEVAEVEYRLERAGGIGPGGKETGFVAYRLTAASTRWARSHGGAIGRFLSGGQNWQATPIIAKRGHPWHPYDGDGSMGPIGPHATNISEYLDQYGFSIPVDKARAAEFDRAIQAPGSYYQYGRGGSVTIIDPAQGKVYFAYAG